jgi:hypothetical protein
MMYRDSTLVVSSFAQFKADEEPDEKVCSVGATRESREVSLSVVTKFSIEAASA